jgi:hypothetical protein
MEVFLLDLIWMVVGMAAAQKEIILWLYRPYAVNWANESERSEITRLHEDMGIRSSFLIEID